MNLEVQISQLAKLILEEQKGSLPNKFEVNLNKEDMEHYL